MRGHSAFTIIEVLVSVVLISIVVLGVVKIEQDSKRISLYLLDRGKVELSNTLFLGRDIKKYHKDEKDAYSIISSRFKISKLKDREVLREIKRKIFISDPVELSDDLLPVVIDEIMLKDQYSSRFMHFEVR
jgi:prepilin-type N-terminal cleavage/methylation domain-containing protein